NCGSQHTWGSGSVEHLSTNRSEGPQVHGHLSASYDTLPQFASEGSFHLEPEVNATSASSSIYNGQSMHEANGGLIDYPTGIGRGRFKRKVPGFLPPCATGGTTGFYGAGSSSHPNGLQLGTPPDYRPFPSNSFQLPPHGGGSLTIGGEDSGSSARSIVDSDPNPTRSYFQSYTPGPNGSTSHLPNHHGAVNIHGLNTNAPTYGQNHFGISPPAHQHLHESILSRNPIPAPQYFHGLHALAANEDQANYYQRAMPSQRTDAISLHSGSARPFLTRGLHHNHREGRSRIALERLQARSNAVDAHDRMGGEASMMLEGPYLYGHRNMYDQYGDMRLDIDNMSYEELLALGDSIGNVNTGLSENVISECLLEKKHSISDKNLEESCAICLEEYKKTSKTGKLKKCGHEYHMGCIKKWLSVKNSCPICKGPAAAIPNASDEV
ncbi:E3 ubiquitin-protein ligase MBR1, partial [Linum perenne]